MMDNDMLKNIEYLREKADVSYEEAADMLEKHGGNVMRVLVELEHLGRVYPQPQAFHQAADDFRQHHECCDEAKKKAASFFDTALKHRLVVERKREDGSKETVANVSAPFAAGFAIIAPWVAVATAGIAVATGHHVKLEKPKQDESGDHNA